MHLSAYAAVTQAPGMPLSMAGCGIGSSCKACFGQPHAQVLSLRKRLPADELQLQWFVLACRADAVAALSGHAVRIDLSSCTRTFGSLAHAGAHACCCLMLLQVYLERAELLRQLQGR